LNKPPARPLCPSLHEHAHAAAFLSAPRATILIASPGKGRCKAFALSHGAHSNIALLIRHQDCRHRLRVYRLDDGGAVEDRSQTNVRERLSAAPRSENIAVLRSAARSRAPMLAPQPVKPVPTKSTGPRPGWGGSLDLNEENDRRALITARMYGLVIARRNSGSIAFGRAKAPHKLVDQVDAADQQDRELGTWRDEMMQQNE